MATKAQARYRKNFKNYVTTSLYYFQYEKIETEPDSLQEVIFRTINDNIEKHGFCSYPITK